MVRRRLARAARGGERGLTHEGDVFQQVRPSGAIRKRIQWSLSILVEASANSTRAMFRKSSSVRSGRFWSLSEWRIRAEPRGERRFG